MDILLDAGANLVLARGPLGSVLNSACAMGRVHAIQWLLQNDAESSVETKTELASTEEGAKSLVARRVTIPNEPYQKRIERTCRGGRAQDLGVTTAMFHDEFHEATAAPTSTHETTESLGAPIKAAENELDQENTEATCTPEGTDISDKQVSIVFKEPYQTAIE